MLNAAQSPATPAVFDGDPVVTRRIIFGVGLIYPLWYLATPVGARDAWWTWGVVSLVFLLTAGLAPRVPSLRRQLPNMFPGPWLSTLQVYLLAWLNDMHLFYTAGSVMSVVAISATITTQVGLASYGVFVSTLGLVLFVLDPDPIKAACWFGVLPVVVIAYQRLTIRLSHAQMADDYRYKLEYDVGARTRELSDANVRLRREMEERARLEEELRLVHKLEAVGRLAGGVAHEFNNLLTRIRLYAELALDKEPPGSRVREDVGEIQKAGRQAAVLTRQLLTFSRRGEVRSELVDLNDVVESTSSMLRHLLGEGTELVVLLGDGPLALVADRGQTEHVLVNLVLNARDAMPEGGRLTIETSAWKRSDHGEADLNDPLRQSEYVLLTVTDTGVGMDAQTSARAFDPFFTSKSENSGTGLGLSIVYGVLNQLGGHVRVSSEPGKGARFELYWPRTHGLPKEASQEEAMPEVRGGDERILLVEDEADLRQVLERLLCACGYTVLPADNATLALRIVDEATRPIDLLLSDVVMPGMNGLELAESMRVSAPNTRILLMSGHLEPRERNQPAIPPDVDFLAKPFEANDLLHKIREALDRPERPADSPG